MRSNPAAEIIHARQGWLNVLRDGRVGRSASYYHGLPRESLSESVSRGVPIEGEAMVQKLISLYSQVVTSGITSIRL